MEERKSRVEAGGGARVKTNVGVNSGEPTNINEPTAAGTNITDTIYSMFSSKKNRIPGLGIIQLLIQIPSVQRSFLDQFLTVAVNLSQRQRLAFWFKAFKIGFRIWASQPLIKKPDNL